MGQLQQPRVPAGKAQLPTGAATKRCGGGNIGDEGSRIATLKDIGGCDIREERALELIAVTPSDPGCAPTMSL